jgi:sigma-B regulation protein RsbU (phosphoserine phosphatase)
MSLSNLAGRLQQSHSLGETLWAVRQTLADAYGPVGSIMLATRGLPTGSYRIVQLSLDAIGMMDDDLSPSETVYQGGLISRIISEQKPRLIHDAVWDEDPVFADVLDAYGSVVAVPLVSQRLPMTWILLFKRKPERFTTGELEESMLRAALVASLLESQFMGGELAAANERVDKEVRQAAELQRMLLPSPLPQIPNLDMAVSYEPSGKAGGDLFDVFLLDEASDEPERWCLLVADASGHGLAAAVVMAIMQTIMRAHPPGVSGPAAMLAHANDHLCRKRLGGFVTAFLLIYEPGKQQWCYASAGHLPPLVKKGIGGAVTEWTGASGIPLGIDAETSYGQVRATLDARDTVLIYTDGISEARNAGGEMFEVERIEKLLAESEDSPAAIVSRVRESVTRFQGNRPAADDQTVLVFKVE